MSKLSKNLYTPEQIGEQKGENSPFFHAYDMQKLKEILLKLQNGLSFSDENSIIEFSTFFHEEKRKIFLESAAAHAKERSDHAGRIADLTEKLASAVFRLSSIVSPPKVRETDLLAACASRALHVSDQLSYIDTNILFFIHDLSIYAKSESIFFQIEKNLFFLEQAEKHLELTPENTVYRRQSILKYPPTEVTEHISFVLKSYENIKCFLRQTSIDSTKAARQNNLEKYNNILHNSATRLHDSARLLETSAKDLRAKAPTP